MTKQCLKKDFIFISKDFFLEESDLLILDIYFSINQKNKFNIRIQFIFSHIIFISNKYNINIESIDFVILINELIFSCDSNLDYISLNKNLSFIAANYIEKHYIFSKLAAAFLIESILMENAENFDIPYDNEINTSDYKKLFIHSVINGVNNKIFDPVLLSFDLDALSNHLYCGRDSLFEYIGIFTLSKRFFIKNKSNNFPIETPQGFWMRVAMGLAINETDKNAKAKEFYDLFSQLYYIPSTPTLCHSGFIIPQLSSCYLTVIEDDLSSIFAGYGHSAQLAKWSGGIATSWSHVRACGAYIKKINLESQGIIPYLKIEDDIVASISKTGTRRGGKAVYLENWHYDIDDFLDLKKNTGDHRKRTHDLNTAVWISDLFMKRVLSNEEWTLFSPDEVPLLLSTFGKDFEIAYLQYEENADCGKIKLYKKIPAKELWKKILVRIFETGHPWITFKDPSNIRSPQQHCGIVNSSNLCTEITLNTNENEIAVCNLGSINLKMHVDSYGQFNLNLLKQTIKTAVRMLDNVIDITYYPVDIARNSNLKHRPIGLGVMGWQDVIFLKKYTFESEETAKLINYISEFISFHAIDASSDLSRERGAYQTFNGSLWDKGIFPHDSILMLEKEREISLDMPSIKENFDWDFLRKKIKIQGMRNSNTQAIAPTATISTIVGCFPSIEPIYKNLYVKSNLTGEFSIINSYLVNELISLNLWNDFIIEKIKFYDGSILYIDEIPFHIRNRYKTAFEIDQRVLLHLTALRGQWIDQSQSHNIFFSGDSGKILEDIYLTAWKKGLKTTYYCRTLGKSQIEKATLGSQFGLTQKRVQYENKIICSIENEEGCESCQ
jgi:ribonucleoside-diphosphate reductase alpha chain